VEKRASSEGWEQRKTKLSAKESRVGSIPKHEIYLSNLYLILDYQPWRNHST
jgi:hypothetical protein